MGQPAEPAPGEAKELVLVERPEIVGKPAACRMLVFMLVLFTSMSGQPKVRKITVEVPERLFQKAKREGEGVSEVVRRALELRASQQAWQRLARWSGRVKWSISLEELRED